MSNSFFQFKQFTIQQDQCAMKVGTDGVLLGAWVDLTNKKKCLDVGTGTGLIALMMAQRTAEAHITAVEVDEEAVVQARRNVLNSPWKDRVEMVHCNFLSFQPNQKFDSIVSNPPYFTNNLISPDKQRTLARHNNHMTYAELINKVVTLLSNQGSFSVILPFSQKDYFIALCQESGLNVKRLVNIQTRIGVPFKRILLEFVFSKIEVVEEKELLVEIERHSYSPEYTNLTKDFYLKM